MKPVARWPTVECTRRTAVISGDYRYELKRRWGLEAGLGNILWIMLNPSTADGTKDDATIRRCIRFSQDWGYDSMTVCNLYAYRSTAPKNLWKAPDPVGRENEAWLEANATTADTIVFAWGNSFPPTDRKKHIRVLIKKHRAKIWVLGYTADGEPRHPLRMAADTPLKPLRQNLL